MMYPSIHRYVRKVEIFIFSMIKDLLYVGHRSLAFTYYLLGRGVDRKRWIREIHSKTDDGDMCYLEYGVTRCCYFTSCSQGKFPLLGNI